MRCYWLTDTDLLEVMKPIWKWMVVMVTHMANVLNAKEVYS